MQAAPPVPAAWSVRRTRCGRGHGGAKDRAQGRGAQGKMGAPAGGRGPECSHHRKSSADPLRGGAGTCGAPRSQSVGGIFRSWRRSWISKGPAAEDK